MPTSSVLERNFCDFFLFNSDSDTKSHSRSRDKHARKVASQLLYSSRANILDGETGLELCWFRIHRSHARSNTTALFIPREKERRSPFSFRKARGKIKIAIFGANLSDFARKKIY